MSNTLKLGNGQWATGKDTILAYNDLNSNYKPLAFSFSRDSSATVINKDGLIETVGSGEPRIDFKNNTKGALLLEPSRSNLVANSNFQSGWSVLSGGSITQNQSISPDGTQNAAILSGDGVNPNAAYTFINVTTQEYAYSMFAKKGSEHILRMKGFSGGANGNVEFNLINGTIETSSDGTFSNEKIEDYGNGWYRCSVKITVTSSGSKTFGFNREAIVSGDLFSVYGVQLEQGSYATSYIPTSGQANGVTRVREEVNNENYLMSGLTDMAMFVDYELPNGNSSGFRNQLGFRDNNNANFYMIQFPSSNTYEFRYTGVANVNVDMTPSMSEQDFGLRRKILYTKTGTTLKVFCNGVQVSTVTSASATTFSTTSEILNAGANYDIEMKIKDWKLYNNGFTDAEAIALTTI